MRNLTALVVDDEPLARRKLIRLLAAMDGVECVGEAGTGHRALELIRQSEPDVVFMDVEMPGMTGLQAVERIDRPVQVVFTTAYDEYAVQAFEMHAADYLLKPFGARRLETALDRARQLTRAPHRAGVSRLFVRERGRILPLAVERIVRLEADGDYVRIFAADREHLVTATLQDLHDRLDPDRFVRVHRSHVVNLDHVDDFVPSGGGRLTARLSDGSSVVASRTRSKELRGRS